MTLYAPTSRLVTATFTTNSVADDPDEIVFEYSHEDDPATQLIYSVDVEVVRASAGVYTLEVDCTEEGWWRARAVGTWDDGSDPPSYRTYEESWYVSRSKLTPPASS